MNAQIEQEAALDLRQFFTGLADAGRLRVAGQLAAGDATAEALAAALGETPAAVTRHLAMLERMGLVAGPSGAAQTYRLRLDAIHGLAAQVLARPQTVVPDDAAEDEYDRKALKDFLTPEGRLKEVPVPERKFMAVLRYIFKAFEPGRDYSEKEVNAVLEAFHPDFATLRRALIDRRMLERESDGRVYRKVKADG
ncbi:MAG: DUF2087 domain-containing protein [Anaerolineales bacterium]